MASLDIFHADPFTTIALTEAVERVPYRPDMLGQLAVFTPTPIRTKALMVEQRQGKLTLIPFSDRGSPGTQRTTEQRQARYFQVPRIRMEDTIYADELAAIREFGSETELMQVQRELGRRLVGPTGLRSNIEYTREYHRLAAIQGLLLDATGAVLHNWYNEFAIQQPAEIVFNFAAINSAYAAAGSAGQDNLTPLCRQVIRAMQRSAQGAWIAGRTKAVALCGDAFFDALTSCAPFRSTFINFPAAALLREANAFRMIEWGDIEWYNYRGSDDLYGVAGEATASSGTIAAPGMPATIELLGQAVSVIGLPVTGPGLPPGSTIGSVVAGTSFTLANSAEANESVGGVYNIGPGSISIPSNKVKFFPRNANGVFQVAMAPGESFEWINTLGKPEYVRMIPDRDRNEWVKAEMTAYPLHICTRPEVLQSGTMDASAD